MQQSHEEAEPWSREQSYKKKISFDVVMRGKKKEEENQLWQWKQTGRSRAK